MKGGRYRFDVERFVLRRDTTDAPSRLELDGWIVSDVAIERVRLVSPGSALPVSVDPQADDDDPRLLLSLREDIEADGAFEQSAIEVEAANGDRLAFDVGHLFRPPDWMPPVLAFGGDPGALALAVPSADALACALADGFAGLADRDDLFMHRADHHAHGDAGTWLVTSHRYGLHFPTSLDGKLGRAEAREHAWPTLRSLAASLLDRIDRGVPLLVHRGTPADTEETMASLFDALRARNPDAVLLWLDPCRHDQTIVRHRREAVGPAEPNLLVASATAEWSALLGRARDLLVAPR